MAVNGQAVRYWLLLLQNPGEWIEFNACDYGITVKTLFAYIEAESFRSGGIYRACRIDTWRVGVRRVQPAGGGHG